MILHYASLRTDSSPWRVNESVYCVCYRVALLPAISSCSSDSGTSLDHTHTHAHTHVHNRDKHDYIMCDVPPGSLLLPVLLCSLQQIGGGSREGC